jgi:flagellar hook-basal body complex protein FliE
MTDPLGLIGSGSGIGPVRNDLANGRPLAPGQPAFKDVLLDTLKEVNAMQQDANRAVEDLTSGKRNDLESVVIATNKADTAFRMLQQVRNRMMEAYEEIKQMRV